MSKVVLNEAAVLAGVRQIEAAAVAELVGMDMRQARPLAGLAQ